MISARIELLLGAQLIIRLLLYYVHLFIGGKKVLIEIGVVACSGALAWLVVAQRVRLVLICFSGIHYEVALGSRRV